MSGRLTEVVKKIIKEALEPVEAASARQSINEALAAINDIVGYLFVFIVLGVAIGVLLDAFNITDVTQLQVVGVIFKPLMNAIGVGAKAVMIGFVGIILGIVGGAVLVLKGQSFGTQRYY